MARLAPLTLLLSAAALPVAAQSPAPAAGTYEEWATPSDFQEAPPPAPPAALPAAPDAPRVTADQAAAEQVRAARAEALAAEQAARIARERAQAALQALQIAERDARAAKQAVEVTEERIRAEQQLRAAEEQARAAEQVRLAEQRRQAEEARLQAQALREEQLRQAEHARLTEQARKAAEREVLRARFQQEQAEEEARRHAAQAAAEAELEAEAAALAAAEEAYDPEYQDLHSHDDHLQYDEPQQYGQVARVNEVPREVAETPFLSLTADGALHDRRDDFGLYNLGLRFEGERGGLLATMGGIATSGDDWSYFTIEPTFAVVATQNFRWRLRAGWSSAFTRNVAMSGVSGGSSMVIHIGGPVDLELDGHLTMVPFFRFDTTAAWALNFGGLSVRAGWRASYLNDLGHSGSPRVSHAGYFGPFLGLGLHI